jgi:hypothetical protein
MSVELRITEGITMINDETRRKLRKLSMEEMIFALDLHSSDKFVCQIY